MQKPLSIPTEWLVETEDEFWDLNKGLFEVEKNGLTIKKRP